MLIALESIPNHGDRILVCNSHKECLYVCTGTITNDLNVSCMSLTILSPMYVSILYHNLTHTPYTLMSFHIKLPLLHPQSFQSINGLRS